MCVCVCVCVCVSGVVVFNVRFELLGSGAIEDSTGQNRSARR